MCQITWKQFHSTVRLLRMHLFIILSMHLWLGICDSWCHSPTSLPSRKYYLKDTQGKEKHVLPYPYPFKIAWRMHLEIFENVTILLWKKIDHKLFGYTELPNTG